MWPSRVLTMRFKAEEGVVDLNKETGTFTDATILRKSLDLHLEGKTIEKTGFNTYHIEQRLGHYL